jgi:hypothetical protein
MRRTRSVHLTVPAAHLVGQPLVEGSADALPERSRNPAGIGSPNPTRLPPVPYFGRSPTRVELSEIGFFDRSNL